MDSSGHYGGRFSYVLTLFVGLFVGAKIVHYIQPCKQIGVIYSIINIY